MSDGAAYCEPSRRIPLRAAVDVYLRPYRPGGATGSASSPTT